jgi:hypothetical protein
MKKIPMTTVKRPERNSGRCVWLSRVQKVVGEGVNFCAAFVMMSSWRQGKVERKQGSGWVLVIRCICFYEERMPKDESLFVLDNWRFAFLSIFSRVSSDFLLSWY